MSNRSRLGSREWHERFQRDLHRFDRMWPWWIALSILAAIAFIVLIVTGVLPIWLLFV